MWYSCNITDVGCLHMALNSCEELHREVEIAGTRAILDQSLNGMLIGAVTDLHIRKR